MQQVQPIDEAELGALLARGDRDARTFGRLRAALGLAPDEMAALLGLRAEDVARFETGAGAPDAATWSLLEQLVRDHLALRAKVRDPGEWIGDGHGR